MSSLDWWVYIIEASDDSLYTGITTDVQRRWREHSGAGRGARYFRGRSPRALAYLERSVDRASASRREWAIKQLGRPAKLSLIAGSGNLLLSREGCDIDAHIKLSRLLVLLTEPEEA